MIILPCLALAAGVVGGAIIFFYDIRQAVQGGVSQPALYRGWTQTLFMLELIMTWLLTLTITGKLWWVGVRTASSREGGWKYKKIVLALIEGGALYSAVSGWLLISYMLNAVSLIH